MKALDFSGGILIKLERGEEVTAAIQGFLDEKRIVAGTISGLGGVRDAELGYYDLESRTYQRTTVAGNLELVSYQGNITLLDGAPFVHAHAVLSGPDFRSYGGHFFSAVVAITGEFVLRPADWSVERIPDEATGLNLMGLPG